MKVRDLLNCRFSTYSCAGDSNRADGDASLREWLGEYAIRYENRIDCAREWYRSDKDFYKKIYKKYRVRAAAMCGIFPTVRSDSVDDMQLNGLIVMDIDTVDDVENLKRKCLENIDCAFLATKSLSGAGIYVVCHYDTYYNFKDIWRSLRREFKEKIGIDVDDSCSDCSRLRILSSDNNILIKNWDTDIVPYDKIEEQHIEIVDEESLAIDHVMTKESYKELTECIGQLVKNGYGTDGFSYYDTDLYEDNGKYDYAKWRRDAWRLGSLERSDIGRRLFQFISRHAEGFVDDFDVNNMFNKYTHRCPDNNNVGYYFALRERLSH